MAEPDENKPPKRPEIREPEVIESWGMAPLAALNRVEIDIQIATAKRWPRSIGRFKEQVRTLATLDEETAGSMFYALPREGRTIDGPSIRFAEIVGSAWTNLRYGARIIGMDERHVTAQGAAFDLETNLACTVDVKRRITDKHGRRYSDDMITVTSQAAMSIALRNAIFRVVPFALCKEMYEEARAISIGKGKTIAQRRQSAIEIFQKWGVSPDRLCLLVGKASVDDLDDEALIKLRGIVTAIRDGDTTIDEVLREASAPEPPKEGGKLGKLTEKLAQDRRSEGGPVAPPAPPPGSPTGEAAHPVPEAKLEHVPPAPLVGTAKGEEAGEAAGIRGESGEGARHPLGGKTSTSAPEANMSGASREADVGSTPTPGSPPAGDSPAEQVMTEIVTLFRSLKVKPEEEQFLWDQYGKGQHPMPVASLVAMRDFLQTTADKRAKGGRR